MISRKWLYSYRMLTARLHEQEHAATVSKDGFTVGSAELKPRETSVTDELTGSKAAKPALMLRAEKRT